MHGTKVKSTKQSSLKRKLCLLRVIRYTFFEFFLLQIVVSKPDSISERYSSTSFQRPGLDSLILHVKYLVIIVEFLQVLLWSICSFLLYHYSTICLYGFLRYECQKEDRMMLGASKESDALKKFGRNTKKCGRFVSAFEWLQLYIHTVIM
jgi:hypothetical protein